MLGIITNGKTSIEIRLALQWDETRKAYIGPLEEEGEEGTPIVVVTPTAFLKAMVTLAKDGGDITEALDPSLWEKLIGKEGITRDIEPPTT